jgi:hypothetical protein
VLASQRFGSTAVPVVLEAFWPHGLNRASEATSADEYIRNVRMVAALRQDMGL